MKSKLWIPVAAILMMITIAAQTSRTIYGTVTSADDGSRLPGINVVLKGATTGAVTDASGNYSIVVPATGGKLVFSFVGFKTQELAIGSADRLNVKMEMEVQNLQEVVVSGVKPREKKSLFGAASIEKR